MSEPERVVVIVTQQLGDVLLTTPLLRAIRTRWPRVHLAVFGFSGTLGMLEGNPDVDERIEVPRGGRDRLTALRAVWARRRTFDIAFVTQAGDRPHLYGWLLAKVRSSVLPRDPGSKRWKHWITQHGFEGVPDQHAVLEKLQLLDPFGVDPNAKHSVTVPAPHPLPSELLGQLRHGYVVVHVPSLMAYKQWPVGRFREVVDHLVAQGHQVVLSGSATSDDLAKVAQVQAGHQAPEVLNLAGRLNLNQVVMLLQGAHAYLGPDASISHLAAAAGTDSVVIFGPTSPAAWGPWPQGSSAQPPWQAATGQAVRVQRVGHISLVQGPDAQAPGCVPCRRSGCLDRADSSSACLERLPTSRVISELEPLLASRPAA